MAPQATKGDEDAVAGGRYVRCFFAGSLTGRSWNQRFTRRFLEGLVPW
jgi:hypothetical protein